MVRATIARLRGRVDTPATLRDHALAKA
jgi:hypothetical protein